MRKLAAVLGGLMLVASSVGVKAATVEFLCAGALETSVEQLIPEFRRATGHNVNATYAAISVIAQRLARSDKADLAIVSPRQWEDLQRQGKLDAGFRVTIARVGAGVFVKRGTARPNIATVDAFKHALLNGNAIAISGGGPVGIYALRLFDQLGIGADVKAKLKLVGGGLAPIAPVVNGDAEIGLSTISEILAAPDVELVGPLPAEIQTYIVYIAGIPTNANETTTPAAATLWRIVLLDM